MKILFLRFSSIGDIVLTFPVVKAVSEQVENVEIHYATKIQFKDLLIACKSIDKVHFFENRTSEIWEDLKSQNFDYVIDLHYNIRTIKLTRILKIKTFRFPKLNIQKWIMVKLKWDLLPEKHVVDRYFEALRPLGIKNENKNNQFHIPDRYLLTLNDWGLEVKSYLAIALGAKYKTKQLPLAKLLAIINQIDHDIVLLGGKTESDLAKQIISNFQNRKIVDLVGKLSILESAYIVKNAASLLTNDSGLMHIASCFDVPIHITWGNTISKFGMYPYKPENPNLTLSYEVKIKCRPCSKIGFSKCPKGHHNCLNLLSENKIAEGIKKDLS